MPTNRREESAEPADPVSWLLASGEPAIRRLVRQDLLDLSDPGSTDDVLAGPLVRGLFAGRGGPNEMITLNAFTGAPQAGRFDPRNPS